MRTWFHRHPSFEAARGVTAVEASLSLIRDFGVVSSKYEIANCRASTLGTMASLNRSQSTVQRHRPRLAEFGIFELRPRDLPWSWLLERRLVYYSCDAMENLALCRCRTRSNLARRTGDGGNRG